MTGRRIATEELRPFPKEQPCSDDLGHPNEQDVCEGVTHERPSQVKAVRVAEERLCYVFRQTASPIELSA